MNHFILYDHFQFRSSAIPGAIRQMPKRPKRVRKQRKTIDKDEKPSNWKEKAVKIMKNAWFYDCSVQWYHFNGKF